MFLLNVGYRWTMASNMDLAGTVYLPTGNSRERLVRTRLPDPRRRLFDPQLYIAELPSESCWRPCSKLATYPWFCAEVQDYNSDDGTRSVWEREIRDNIADYWPCELPEDIEQAAFDAVSFQLEIGCTHLILPTPLIANREDEAAALGEWIDAGIAACQNLDVGQPKLATIAVDESILIDAVFEPAGFLDTVADQVTAREDVDGVYVLVVQTHARHPFLTESPVLRAYLWLCDAFSQANYRPIIVNFCGTFGQVCLAAGATDFASGPSHPTRRMSFEGFEESGGGRAVPKYYSNRTIGEYRTETDLDRIVSFDMFDVVRDATVYSEPLLAALDAGRTAASVPLWAESQNNLSESHFHFVARLFRSGAFYSRFGVAGRRTRIRGWLERVVERSTNLEDAVPDLTHAPAQLWLDTLEGVIE